MTVNHGKGDLEIEEMLRPELIVLRQIGTYQDKGVHLGALNKSLGNRMSRNALIKALARLEELGMVRAEWAKAGRRWRRNYFVSGEGTEYFLRKLNALF